jgi:hypothetical protein
MFGIVMQWKWLLMCCARVLVDVHACCYVLEFGLGLGLGLKGYHYRYSSLFLFLK